MIFQNCLKFHSPITAREREITSDNFEIQPQIMLLPMQIPYKFPIYECTSAFFVHVLGKCCLVSQISSQRSRLYVCLNYGVEWRVGEGSKGFNKWSSHVYSRGSLWIVLLQHTTPWGQLIHWPLTYQWTSKKILDQVRPSGKLPTYASPNSTLTLTSQDKIFWLGEG